MSRGLPFEFEAPISVWLNKSAPEGMQRRIGGLITTDNRDRQGEIILQKGLDFTNFLNHGWFNDNHSKATDGVVGFPIKKSLKYIRKGEKLPNGAVSPGNGHWAEGYLLQGHDRADKLWNLAQVLQKSGEDRRLGFSIEGSIKKRQGPGDKVIAKAVVKNVAVTNCPVNTDTRLDTLAKSLMAVEESNSPDELWKALGMGTTGGPQSQPAGPQTGETAGQVLSTESLESVKRKDEDDEDSSKKSLTPERAWELAQARFPGISAKHVARLVRVTQLRKAQGAL